jgi:hypothetical protein
VSLAGDLGHASRRPSPRPARPTELSAARGVRLKPALQVNFARFLHGGIGGVIRGPCEARPASLEEELNTLGRELGSVLFADEIGDALNRALAATRVCSNISMPSCGAVARGCRASPSA